MAHATHMAAMNAARKQFGKDWKESAHLEKVDGEWYVQLIQKEAPAPEAPVEPAVELVAAQEAPAPTPAIPAFLETPVIAPTEVPGLDLEAMAAAADKAANAEAVNSVDPLRPRISTAEKPTKKVWAIADSMPGAKRKEVIEECVRQGIAYGTARTQYQHWFKCINDQKVAPIATIGADGKITMPGK